MLNQSLFFLFPLITVLAGIGDLLTMKIPNRITMALLAGFCIAAPFAIGWNPSVLAGHLGAGLIMLVVGFAFFAFGWIGGGDAKFAAVAALWLGLPQLLAFVVFASVFGGILTIALMLFRYVPLPQAAERVVWIDRLHTLAEGIPYGLALAASALAVYPKSIWINLMG